MQNLVYRIATILAKSGVFLISLLAFVGVLIVAVTQLTPFRKWAIEQGLNRVNEMIQGRLTVEDIEGNLVNGLTLRGVRLEADDTTFAWVPKIELSYELLPILESRSVGASLILFEPEVLLRRSADSVWNFTKIARPQPDTDEPRTPLEWIFDIRSLEIRDGTIAVRDYVNRPVTGEDTSARIDPLNTTLRRFNLEAATYISEEYQRFLIRHLSFVETGSDLRLIDLAGDVEIDNKEGVSVSGLRVETDGSFIQLDGTIASRGLFDSTFGRSLGESPIALPLDAERVDMAELRLFIPELDLFAGTVQVALEAEGELDDITVPEFELVASGTTVQGNARLESITDPEEMLITASLEDSRLYYLDLERHVPGVDLSDFSYLRLVEVERLDFSGRPSDATATFTLSTSVGDLVGGGTVYYGEEELRWRGDVTAEDLQLDEVTRPFGLVEGEVTGRFVVEGRVVDPAGLEARARVRLGRSKIAGRSIDRAWIDANFGEGGLLQVDTLLVAFSAEGSAPAIEAAETDGLYEQLVSLRDSRGGSSFVERIALAPGEGEFFNGRPSVRGAGWYDMREPDMPKYRGRLESDRLDISDITLDPAHDTRLGLMVRFEGRGIDPDRMEGFLQLDAYDIRLPGGEEILPFQVDSLLLELNGSERRLLLASDVANAEIVGTWRFESLFPTLVGGFEKLSNYVARKSSYTQADIALLTEDDYGTLEPIAATYRFEPKDLSILEAFLPGTTLELDADLRGTISGTPSFLGITIAGDIRRFLYSQGETTYRFAAVTLDADIRNISSGAMDDLLDAEISIQSDSLYHISDMDIAVPSVDLTFRDGRLNVQGAATVDGEYSVNLDATVDVVANEGYRLEFDSLSFAMDDGLRWTNVGQLQLLVNEQGIDFESFAVRRDGAEQVEIIGRIEDFERFRDLQVSVSSVPLAQLQAFVPDATTRQMIETFGGKVDSLQVQLNGTLESPVIEARFRVDNLRYTNVAIGSVLVNANYADRNLTGTMQIVANATDSLSAVDIPLLADVEILSLPIDLAFAPREERLIQGRAIDISGRTNRLPLAILGPFVPGILIQGGQTDLEFSVRGTLPDIDYSGVGTIAGGRILVESTNMSYFMDARFELAEERLELMGVSLRNIPSDYAGGRATAFGNITFDGFAPQDFNIEIRTAGLKVLSDATQAVNDVYYGDLVIATPPGATLTFGGTYARPTLRGDLIVLESDLKYPYRDRISELQGRVDFLEYEEWTSDSARQVGPQGPPDIPDSVKARLGMSKLDSLIRADSLNRGGERRFDEEEEEGIESDFMDRLFVNVDIYIPRGVRMTIEIGLLQRLELTIDDGQDDRPLQFSMLGDAMSLSGEVRLLQGSRFIFVRTFDASGSIVFDQNILNPAFDIQGEYNGRRYMNGVAQRFTVELILTGTLERPLIDLDYTIEGVANNDDRAQKQTDAILLLVTGRRESEFTGGSEEELAANAVLSGADVVGTSVLGAALGGIFSYIGGLQAVEFDGNIDDPGGTTFRFIYAFDDVLVRYEGRITQLSDGTVTVELPLELLLDVPQLKNLSLELQRAVVDEFGSTLLPSQTSSATDQVFRIRFSLRWTF